MHDLKAAWATIVVIMAGGAMASAVVFLNVVTSLDKMTRGLFTAIVTGGMVSGLAWFLFENFGFSWRLEMGVCIAAGALSHWVVQGFVTLGERFAKNPEQFLRGNDKE